MELAKWLSLILILGGYGVVACGMLYLGVAFIGAGIVAFLAAAFLR